MIKTLQAKGYKTQVQTLSHFYDDYGLKADEEDGEEEDEEEDDDDMSEGSYESGSGEDDD